MKNKKGSENWVVDYLSRINTKCTDDLVEFSDHFFYEQLFAMSCTLLP